MAESEMVTMEDGSQVRVRRQEEDDQAYRYRRQREYRPDPALP